MISGLTNQQLLFSVALLGVIAWQIRSLINAYSSLRWQSTTGKVLEAFVDQSNDGEGGVSFSPKVRYTYTVDTRSFESSRFSYQAISLNRLGEVSNLLRGIAKGREVIVFYDRRSPTKSVLLQGYNSSI